MYRSFFAIVALFLLSMMSSCVYKEQKKEEANSGEMITYVTRERVLVTDEELIESMYKARVDELFDDFLYCYIRDTMLQAERTCLQEDSLGNSVVELASDEFDFMRGDYTSVIYSHEQDNYMNEDTTLQNAFLEKIDLLNQQIRSYSFTKNKGRWKLNAVKNLSFEESDMADFLKFYSKFSSDESFQNKSLARSIHISMAAPDDDGQTIEGFVDREQWPTLSSGVPSGVISNIRYGQNYKNATRIYIEKMSMGDGMCESFFFRKNRRKWELSGYEN